MRTVVWGAGELGTRVLAKCVRRGDESIGYTKTDKRHGELAALGVTARRGSPDGDLQESDVLVLAIAGSTKQYDALTSLSESCPTRAILISSVGFFGQPHGVVDERTPVGDTDHAANVARTESAFRHWAGERGTIIRLGGLYRGGRGPMSALVRRGYPPLGAPDRTLALIHYDDAAEAVFNALRRTELPPLVVAATPPCPTREDFYTAACARARLPAPTFSERLNKPLARYDVSLLKATLLSKPQYPDWQAALDDGLAYGP